MRSALSSRAPSNFNSRPSARGDFGFGAQRIHRMLFQFTPLREGRLCDSLRASSKHSFQFTPLREGRRARRDRTQHRRQISIHAPPRGATNEVIRQRKKRNISIHAPPRGATTLPAAGILNRRHFNSRPSARGDGTVSKSALCVIRFQFTPLREGRLPRMLSEGEAGENFNSRPSARGDAVVVGLCAGRHISIHAPPRGATRRCRKASASSIISIHAPPRGATILTTEGNPVALNISIHAPPRGATPAKRRNGPRPQISIHAPPRGATSIQARYSYQRQDFNSRPSARGDCRRAPPTRRSQLFQFTPLREGRRGAEGCRCKSC